MNIECSSYIPDRTPIRDCAPENRLLTPCGWRCVEGVEKQTVAGMRPI